MEEIGKDLWGAVGNTRGVDGWRAEEASGIEAGKDVAGGGEEEGKAEGEVIRGVAWGGEDVSWDTEVLITDFDEDFGLEKLGLESRKAVKLGIGEQLHEVATVYRADEVALQMSCDLSEGFWIPIYEQCPHTSCASIILFKLIDEESREVRGCSSDMIDAPESLNNSEPIWIEKPFSSGRLR